MKSIHLGMIVIILIAYLAGAKFPMLAQKIGVV